LVNALREGDKEAFAEIYNRFHKPVYRYLISMIKVPEHTEDLVHEIFLKLWEIRQRLDIHTNFQAYIFRVAHNKAVDEIRKMVHDRRLRAELSYKYQELTISQNESPSQLNHYDKLVEQALDSLTPQRRKVYELCRIEGKTYQDAADELNLTHNTVKEHMSKAMASLRHFLAERGELTLAIVLLGNILQ
jgi:RNA polymerase sigma-70 factor (family 1)